MKDVQKYKNKIKVVTRESSPSSHPSGSILFTTQTETLPHIISGSYPVHRLCPSIQWCMYIFHFSCYRWLHSDTSNAVDSLPQKTLQGILGKEQRDQTFFWALNHLLYRCSAPCCVHSPSAQLGPVQPGRHAHCPVAGWQVPLLRQLQVWLHPSP